MMLLKLVLDAKENKEALSVGLVGNAGEILPEILNRGIITGYFDRSNISA
jgi:urocanate hydratase